MNETGFKALAEGCRETADGLDRVKPGALVATDDAAYFLRHAASVIDDLTTEIGDIRAGWLAEAQASERRQDEIDRLTGELGRSRIHDEQCVIREARLANALDTADDLLAVLKKIAQPVPGAYLESIELARKAIERATGKDQELSTPENPR